MKAALKYPVFYLAPAEHLVYVFWREENVTTRRLLAEADGWAGQEVGLWPHLMSLQRAM